MKYFFLIILLFIGCYKKNSSKEELNNTKEINITKPIKQTNIKIVKTKEFSLNFKDDKLIYPKEKMIILFYDDGMFSKEEIRVLNRLKIKYYKTKNKFLQNYFNINYFPTIIILDHNKTIKFENFTPYEILKTERF